MSETEYGLKRSLGLGALVAVEIGLIIGAGIFVLVGVAMKETGPSVPIAFLVAAVPIMLVMLSLAMIGSAVPCAGGTYRYSSRLVSPGWAWLGVWGYLIGMVFGAFPLYALRAAEYFSKAFPGLDPGNWPWFMSIYRAAMTVLPQATPMEFLIQIGAAAILTFFFAFNVKGVQFAGMVQGIMVVVLLAALIYFVVAGVPHVKTENLSPLFPKGAAGLFLASAILTLALLGANGVIELGAEIKNPGRNIPLSLAISVPSVAVLYVLIGVIAVGVAPWDSMKGTLLSEQAKLVLSSAGMKMFFIGGAFLAITTSINGLFMCCTKSMLVVTSDRLLPTWLHKVHSKWNTPYRFLAIIWLLGVVSIFFKVPAGTFESYASIGGLMIFLPLMIAVIRFPKILPKQYQSAPFKLKGVWLYLCPGLGMILSLGAILMLFFGELKFFWQISFLAMLAVGEAIYLIQKYRTISQLGDHLQRNVSADLALWSSLAPDNPMTQEPQPDAACVKGQAETE